MDQSQTRNPYTAPNGDYEWPNPTAGGTASVLIGAAIGMGTFTLVIYPLRWFWMWMLTFDGMPMSKLYVSMANSTPYLSISHATGALCVLTGGYWCARLSKDKLMLHAFLAGLLLTILAITQIILPYHSPVPGWSEAVSLILPIPGYMLGALWQRRGRRTSTTP